MTLLIEEHIPLAKLTTMRVGGSARFFARVETIDDLRVAVDFARENNLPLFVLGGGSNTLVPDEGFPGLVLKVEIKGIVYEDADNSVRMIAGAGEVWDEVVRDAVARELWGIENLSLIPGTVGGAVVQNIGAYGVEAGERVLWVEAFDTRTMHMKKFLRDECAFGYRESIFKNDSQLIVVRAAFDLARTGIPNIAYEDAKTYFAERDVVTPSLADIRDAIVAIRTAKMPAPPLGTAGSFFKNPVVSAEEFARLEMAFPGVKAYKQKDGSVKLSAAWLLDKVGGWRGFRRGDAGVHEHQALILVNYSRVTTDEMMTLAREMQTSIKEKTNVMIEEEVVMMRVRS